MGVVMFDVIANRLFELRHATNHAVSQAVLRQVAEQAFDHVQPRTQGRREVPVKPRMLLEPRQHFRMLVCGVVVDDQMHIESRRRLGLDLFEKPDPFLMPVPQQAVPR